MNDSNFMDIPMLVGYIHFSKSSIYKMVEQGKIPYVKVNNRLRFFRDDIDVWMLNNGRMYHLPKLPNLD
jgi:excisionase family DNA binding protein